VTIEEFNELGAAEACALVEGCARVPAWAAAVAAARPYDDAAALHAHADALAADWTDAQVSAALADHPRIGERHAGAGAAAEHSEREQAGVDPHDTDVRRRLAEGNAAYEERFDRIYLVRAAGRSAEEILALLEERLGNDPATELRVTAGQLREIAALRLQGAVA
jgi:2-oxo-4-hydroxy-4-carboxy-5-ureidoimidazoline decarboxylase